MDSRARPRNTNKHVVVRGDVTASGHLEIGPKGRIVGDVTTTSFRMHEGGVFRGMSRMPSG